MSKSKKNDSAFEVYVFIGSLLLLPLIFVAYGRYKKLARKYLTSPEYIGGRRVFETSCIWPTVVIMAVSIVMLYMFVIIPISAGFALDGVLGYFTKTLSFAAYVFILWLYIRWAKRLACIYFGVWIAPAQDKVVLLNDLNSLGIFDYLSLNTVKLADNMVEIPLSGIKRISRQSGTTILLHGDFGSYSFDYASKQKRDECITAIQSYNKNSKILQEIEN